MKSIYRLILLFSLSLICSFQVFGQEKVNLFAGVSVPEQFVIGPRIHFNQVQLGLGIGNSNYRYSVSGDISYHFGGNTEFSEIKPWYLKGGLSKWIDHSDNPDNNLLGFYFRTGRDFNLSNKLGINIEFGIITGKMASDVAISGHPRLYPCWGIFFFYRI